MTMALCMTPEQRRPTVSMRALSTVRCTVRISRLLRPPAASNKISSVGAQARVRLVAYVGRFSSCFIASFRTVNPQVGVE